MQIIRKLLLNYFMLYDLGMNGSNQSLLLTLRNSLYFIVIIKFKIYHTQIQ